MKKLMLMMVMLVSALWGQAQEHELKIGEALPGFELKSSVYGNVKPADLKGKVVLVSLFATWCGPCQKELAEVQSTLWPKYKDNKNFVMLVIGREHTDEQLQKYNERKKFTFPLYPDPKREVFPCLQRNPFHEPICLERMENSFILPWDIRLKNFRN